MVPNGYFSGKPAVQLPNSSLYRNGKGTVPPRSSSQPQASCNLSRNIDFQHVDLLPTELSRRTIVYDRPAGSQDASPPRVNATDRTNGVRKHFPVAGALCQSSRRVKWGHDSVERCGSPGAVRPAPCKPKRTYDRVRTPLSYARFLSSCKPGQCLTSGFSGQTHHHPQGQLLLSEGLDLSDNGITTIEAGAFTGLGTLEKLQLFCPSAILYICNTHQKVTCVALGYHALLELAKACDSLRIVSIAVTVQRGQRSPHSRPAGMSTPPIAVAAGRYPLSTTAVTPPHLGLRPL
ncbi:hypothetical protein Bbelb_294290 [Branchiostoma belcheri]|nr:hypothetical protein Bbelb_294290 [Branchiostoma belcheri]